ncbi:tripartite motif-containing protein 16-like protein [Girardinichthys multiradiatus]|uniref:tripartite motif-containing protein 16-like protein n=1 Tax=Girardinichthys multiradiatus TaxID=208333 RepID=UPI001FAC192B|nr:tripartite motif-containing protein 16-like protein [Girardinichthys multiradiatus]
MEQQGVQVDRETFSCSICLDLLKDPVTIPCGHSYCMNCIKTHWNQEAQKGIHSCPQCRKTFMPRPGLEKNTMLATVVEQLKTGLYSPPEAGPEDLACDFCTGRKLKAIKFCLGHDTVSAAAERTERQRELEVRREEIQQRIQDREKDVKLLQQEVEAINHSADKTVEDSEKIFTELIRLIQKRSSDVKQQIRSQQETEVSRVKELQEKLEQEITELKRKDAELKQLSNTEDHNQFLHNYPSLSALSESTHSSSINIRPLRYFEDVTAAVSELRDKLQDILRDTWTNISPSAADGDLKTDQEPKSRTDYLRYSCPITLDPNTAHTQLILSEENRKVTLISQHQSYSSHPDRFTGCCQVLSRESLTGRCYWEVEWRGRGGFVAVSYKNISRTGARSECAFGHNDKSWALDCYQNRYTFFHKKIKTSISGPGSSRVGVYLDHRAGLLSFYSVSETMTLLHRVQTTFTQPLHAGVWVYYTKVTAEFCKLR